MGSLDTEVKIELPGRDILWQVPVLVCEGEPHLNNLEQVDVTPHGLVMVVGRRLERAYRPCYNTGEFGILGTK